MKGNMWMENRGKEYLERQLESGSLLEGARDPVKWKFPGIFVGDPI